MAEPRFSVVIPTRERPDTLRVALRTCLRQDFDDYEVVVCDNFGSPAVRRVVDECASSRVRYVRSDRLLSMSSNYELAVSEARGEYVLLLGDDDGLLSYGLRELDRLIGRDRPPAVRWTAAYYTWPTIDLPGQGDYLRIPLGRGVRTVDARAAIAAASRFEACYSTLPTLYHNSVVRRDLIDRLRARTGRVFASGIPDVYSGFAVGWLCGAFLSLDAPMTVAGTSGASFGVATLFHRGKSQRDREFRSLNSQEGLAVHRWVPDLPIFPFVPVAESFLLAKEALFPGEESLALDRRALAAHCVSALRAENEDEWRAALALIRATFDDDAESQVWFDATLAGRPFAPPGPVQLRSTRLGFDGEFLHLDAKQFGVEDVDGAARLCEKVLAYQAEGVRPTPVVDQPKAVGASRPAVHQPADAGRSPTAPAPSAVAELQAAELDVFRSLAAGLETQAMIDVGAHHGATLAPFLDAGWRVWAFEPIEANRRVMLERARGRERLTVRPEAVSSRSGTARLHLALNLDGSPHDYYHSLERTRADRYHRKGAAVDVPVVSLDDLAARGEIPERVGFLKIDTEGHDLAVLQGAGRLECGVVGVEFWCDRHPLGRSPSPAAHMIRLMAARGYDAYLAMCHQDGGTVVLGSTFEGVRPDAWGNILFFHPSCRGLYQRLLDRCCGTAVSAVKLQEQSTAGTAVPHTPADARLVRLLSLACPDLDGLVVAQAAGEGGDCAAELAASFPATRGVRFGPAAGETVDGVRAAAGRVDLIRVAGPADAAAVLRGAHATLAEGRTAVLAAAALTPPAADHAAFYETMQILGAAGLRLAAVLGPMVSEEGLLASADLLFLPPSQYERCCAGAGPFMHEDGAALMEQARQLQQACDDRLGTIRELSAAVRDLRAVAEERLATIRGLDEERQRVTAAAEERLTAIHQLDAAVSQTRAAADERMAVIRTLEEEVKRLSRQAAAGPWSRLRRAFGRRAAS